MTTPRLQLAVLGPTEVRVSGDVVTLRPRERDVLAALAARHPHPVSVTDLAEFLWVAPPASDAKTLQNHVARIRSALGAAAVQTTGSAYALGDEWALDTARFQRCVDAARRAESAGDHRGARAQFAQAVQLVRGEPFAELEATGATRAARSAWHDGIDDANDGQLRALLQLGEVASAVTAARSLSIGVREQRALLVSLANYRAGRRLDALRTVHSCRQALRDRGVAPGEALLRVEQLLLADDPMLSAPDALAATEAAEVWTGTSSVLVGREAELDRITVVLAAHFDGETAAVPVPVVVTGVAGIGKTALVARVALEARLAGWSVVECPSPVTVAGIQAQRHATEERPLLLVADDAGHLTSADWSLLADGVPRTMLLATSAAEPRTDRATVVRLGPLDEGAVEQLIEVTVGVPRGAASAELVAGVRRGSGGVPGLVVELAIEGAKAPDGTGLARRLVDGLSEPARLLATMVAVAPFAVRPVALLGATLRAGVTVSEREVAECLARRVLREQDRRVTWRDDEVRAALLAGVDDDWVRRARHAWIAQHDIDGDGLMAVAEHLAELPDWPVDDAIARFDAARDLANAEVEFEAVIVNARRALALVAAVEGPDHPDVLRREIDITFFSRMNVELSHSDEQWLLVDRLRALGHHDNLVRLVGLMSSMAATLEADHPDPRFTELIDEALALPADPRIRSEAASNVTDFFTLSDIERCRRYAELSYSDAVAVDDDLLRMIAIEGLSMALGHPTDWPRRVELGQQAVTLSERLDDGFKRGGAMQMVFTGQLQFADPLSRATIDRMRALVARYGRPGYHFTLGFMEASMLHVDGHLAESEAMLNASAHYVPLPQSRLDAVVVAQLFAVRVAQGRIIELRESVAGLAATQPRFGLWLGYQCWIEAAGGNLAGAARLLDEIDDGAALPHTISWAAAAYSAARAAALVGDPARCARVYELLAPHTGLMAWMGSGIVGPIELALAELQLAMGNATAAAEHLAGAQRLVRQLHAPVFEPELADLRERLEHHAEASPSH